MAELILSRVGAAAGAKLLPNGVAALGAKITGAAIGRTIGGLAGRAFDARFLTPAVEGPRIREFHLTEGREGASIPRVYGRMRVGAQLIWTAGLRESRSTSSGKGGPRVRDYAYTLSFAVAVGEGVVSRIARCWANGEPFDLSKVTCRFYRGDEDQTPDPLIEAIEGAGAAPAFRGTAYVVFEDLALDAFGARMPQLSFEIVRPAGSGPDVLEQAVRAVNLIPGAGEFALSTDIVRRFIGPGREVAENQHGAEAVADFIASIDQLEAELPNARRVNLVVGWFGDDLRCGECRIRPGVEGEMRETVPVSWSVAGRTRDGACVVSATDSRPNYGGTPSDLSVRQAIRELKARGIHVTLYPFVFMDVPPGNGLPDPYGGAEQAAFPWRGRITCYPRSVDASAAARDQVEAFFDGDEGYDAFIRHYAELAAEEDADGFIIGSELIGLTRMRDGVGVYPAVERLCALAEEVRATLGVGPELSYAADWTEYGGHVLPNGDVRFPLDPLWASDALSHVGLDWYPPMADWREGDDHADAAFGGPYDRAYLQSNIAGGEAFDWYYADDDGREAQARLPITDGAFGEPWIYRQKDVRTWWTNAHHERTSGVRSATPTSWTPGMKPVRFVEFGCPAADKGPNQPNVFYDPKSSESALPHYSNGERDDLAQRRAIEAFVGYWREDANNPASGVYDGRMIADDGVAVWAWDARPYPAFPANDDAWSDGGNWRLGHWLNGRTGLAQLSDVIADICARAGIEADASNANGVVSGYRVDGPIAARSALEPLMTAYDLVAADRADGLRFAAPGPATEIADGHIVEDEDGRALETERDGLEEAEAAVRLSYIDASGDYAPALTATGSGVMVDVEAPLVMDEPLAKRLAEDLAGVLAARRDRIEVALPLDYAGVEVGDRIEVGAQSYRVEQISDGEVRRLRAWRDPGSRRTVSGGAAPSSPPVAPAGVQPDVVIVDAPPLPGEEDDPRPLAFAFSDPWPGSVFVSAGGDATLLGVRGEIERACTMGRLREALAPRASGRWIDQSVEVELAGEGPVAASELAVLNGANAALIEAGEGAWELVQFRSAVLVSAGVYRLSGLLRGQQGSEPEATVTKPIGARVLFLTSAETRIDLRDAERGATLEVVVWRERPDEATAWRGEHAYLPRTGRMWSPAHLRAAATSAGLALTWIRRARVGGDAWVEGEPPLEGLERYRVRILGEGGVVRRFWLSDTVLTVYAAADAAEDLASGPIVSAGIAQLGRDGLPGAETTTPIGGFFG